MTRTIRGLANVEVESGVAADGGHPFCTVRAVSEDGDVLVGQLDVPTVRKMALDWLGAAEAAEADAMILAELTETVGLDLASAGRFIASLRNRRLP